MILPLLFAALSSTAQAGANPMEVGLRGRYMTMPASILNPWLFPDAGEPGSDRPKTAAWAAGAEFTLANPATQWTFYLERIQFLMGDGFWDDVEDPADHLDGYWIEPTGAFGMIALGANAGKEVRITNEDKKVWLGFVVNGGLGLGITTGNLVHWRAGDSLISDPVADATCLPDSPAYDRHDDCGDDGNLNLPPVLPLLDLNLGLKLNFAEHGYVRLEGSFHDMFAFGGAAGGRF